MGVAERIDGDAGGEIEIALAVGGDEPGALPAFEREIDPGIRRQKVRSHGATHPKTAAKMIVPPLSGGTFIVILLRGGALST